MDSLFSPSTWVVIKKVTLSTIIFGLVFTSVFGFMLVPKRAQAFLGILDTEFSFVMVDIPRVAWQLIQTAVARFLKNMLFRAVEFVIDRIRGNFIVRNFLRYEAVLTRERYTCDYLDLYFPGMENELLRRHLIGFIDYFNRGGRAYDEDLGNFLNAKAEETLGYNPAELSPDDPDYYEKLSRQSNFWSSDIGWYYALMDQSFSVQSDAEKASELNLTSKGIKTSFSKDAESMIKTAESEIYGLIMGYTQSFFDKLEGNSGTLIAGIGNLIGDLSATVVNRVLLGGYVLNEYTDFLSVNYSCFRNISGPNKGKVIGPYSRTDLIDRGGLGGGTVAPPPLPSIPDFCRVEGSAKTNLGQGEVTATGGTGGGTTGGTGGDASAEVDLSDGTITPGEDVDPCATVDPDSAQGYIDNLWDYSNTP